MCVAIRVIRSIRGYKYILVTPENTLKACTIFSLWLSVFVAKKIENPFTYFSLTLIVI